MARYYQPEIETAPREAIRALQGQRLAATVRRVYDRIPFYRNRMQALGLTPEEAEETILKGFLA